MGFFNNFGRVTSATSTTVVTAAETVTTVALATKTSAEVLVIKAKGLKEDAVLEAASDRLEKLAKYKTLKDSFDVDTKELEDEFDAMMASYE